MQADRIVASARCTRAIINNFVNNADRANSGNAEAISAYRIAYIKYIYIYIEGNENNGALNRSL